ncbi:expressed protein [Phakopsora pachyrhizi]|uniref:Expressed protein n=1 Tax=Phakopsora pachyrhizi TaxID=170000 RepID=A0AAV0AXB7_PHAPC|nr:expressed protein [Phakopsora pachyrhizi]
MENSLCATPLVYEIRTKNKVIFLDPPIESARSNWYKRLHQWLGVICSLTRIQSQQYDLGFKLKVEDSEDKTYLSLLKIFDSEKLQKPHRLIEKKVNEVSGYVAKWLQF